MPLYLYCGDSLLTAYLRPGKIDAARHLRAISKLLARKLRATWPKVHITIRADSGFCRWWLLRWCDSNGVGYVIGLAINSKLEGMAAKLLDKARRGFEKTAEKQRHFETIHCAAATWDRPRRVIFEPEHMDKGPNPRFVVTHVPGDPDYIYDEFYCKRSEMENRVKEQQLDLLANRTSCSRFQANQFRLILDAAAYVLMERLRRIGLKGTALERAQAGTIRLKLLKEASRVVMSVRRVVFHLSRSDSYRALFEQALANVLQ